MVVQIFIAGDKMRDKVKPKFNKKLPKNAASFFNPESDVSFNMEHPIIYKVLVACGIAALMFPMIIYMVFILVIYPAPNSAWILLGFAGAFIIGIGFINIVAAWIGQYLGHLVTGLSIGIGVLIVGISILLLYNHTLYNMFNQEMLSLYFINLLFLSLPAIYYIQFREGVNLWLRLKRISKSEIKKCKKGKRNYWWYTEINEKYKMGLIYYLNLMFTTSFSIAFILHFLFGWIKIMSIPVSIMIIFIGVLSSIMSLFASIQSNKTVHGCPFVLVARSENRGVDSFVLDLMIAAFPLAMSYAEMLVVLNLFKLS